MTTIVRLSQVERSISRSWQNNNNFPRSTAIFRSFVSLSIFLLLLNSLSNWRLFIANVAVADDQATGRFAAIWEEQRSSVVTASIEYRWIHVNGRKSDNKLTQDDIIAFIESSDLVNNRSQIKELAEWVTGEQRDEPGWAGCRLLIEGDRVRSELLLNGASHPIIHIKDGEKEIVQLGSAHQQTSIYSVSGTRRHLTSIADLYTTPYLDAKSAYSIDSESNRQITKLVSQSGVITVDAASGAVLRLTYYTKSGSLYQDIFQGEFAVYPGDILFPMWRVKVTYGLQDALVSGVEAFVVDAAVFNQSIPNNAFSVSTTLPNVPVYDYRSSSVEPDRHHLTEEVDDLVIAIENTPLADKSPKSDRTLWLAVILAITGSFLLLVLLARRYAKRRW